ncbi:hypothetical protein OHC33_006983 [Knufia fluminis]|uniref:Increased recombination centers protein 6 n=1 Tax=Knufia fluminis TaxID=191047 RepID=A0AAN8EQY7_9EURO|nr:hypothetical protein OHC33_006983 [Knufia fluminis]
MPPSKEPTHSGLRLLVLAPSTGQYQPETNPAETRESLGRDGNELLSTFLTGLTGSAPSKDLTTFAGYTSHPPLQLRNKYYAADVTLWCDELPANPDLEQWTKQMLSAEAKEAREVIGGIVVVFSHVQTAETTHDAQKDDVEELIGYIKALNELRELIEDESGRDLATAAVVQDMTPKAAAMRRAEREGGSGITSFAETLEEVCVSDYGIFGWDIVAWQPESALSSEDDIDADKPTGGAAVDQPEQSKNEYGERIGMGRILEVLEQTDWSAPIRDAGADDGYGLLSTEDLLDSDDEFTVPSLKPKINIQNNGTKDVVSEQSDEFQREIMGLHFALEEQRQQQTADDQGSGDDLEVEQLAGLMERAIATREAAAEMSKEDREKFARREVSRMMRDMNVASSRR